MLASDVMDSSAALLNDTAKSIFNYTAQIPYLNIALDELQEELELNNVPITDKTAVLVTVPAGISGIGDTGQPALPPNMIQPINLYEQVQGSQNSFMLMQHYQFLPLNQTNTAYLLYWTWEGDKIHFIPGGATGPVSVQIHYLMSIFTTIAASSDSIAYDKAKMYLTYRNAALCAQFIGENKERSDELNGFAGLALNRVLGMTTKGKQDIFTRRKPFMASWRARRIM